MTSVKPWTLISFCRFLGRLHRRDKPGCELGQLRVQTCWGPSSRQLCFIRDSWESSPTRTLGAFLDSNLRTICFWYRTLVKFYCNPPCVCKSTNMEDLSCHASLHHPLSSILISEQSPLHFIVSFPPPSDTFPYSLNSQLAIACRRMNPITFSAPNSPCTI